MGCASSISNGQDDVTKVSKQSTDKIEANPQLNGASSDTKDKKSKYTTDKSKTSHLNNCKMENNNNVKTNGQNAKNAQEHFPNGEIAVAVSITETKDVVEDETEEQDTFDMSIKPTSEYTKEHPTQETLKFIYEHSKANNAATSPTHTQGGFPAFSTEGFASPITGRSYSNRRRPSGVPPPPRELKPGDFLYQKALKARGSLSMAEEEEEES